MPWIAPVFSTVAGGLLTNKATNTVADAQAAADAARLAEEQRVREQLRRDTEVQRVVADAAFGDYEKGLISYAEAQQRAANAVGDVQSEISQAQVADTAKMVDMAKFQPYSIRTGQGNTFFDTQTGQAGFAMSPEAQAYQQSLLGRAGTAAGAIQATPEQAAAQYMQQQQGLLQPQRQAEDLALRNQQLSRGRIGMGISSEAAGAGVGGYVNQEQFQRDRARAQADAQIAANATQEGQAQQQRQLQLAQGMFSAGQQPDQFGLDVMNRGVNIGSVAQQVGAQQAGIYGQGAERAYGSMLDASRGYAQGGLFTPAAASTAAQEAYQRQQTALTGLQGNQLQYQAMNTPAPIIPGSAYTGAAFGNQLMNFGMTGLNNQINPNPYAAQQAAPSIKLY
jgi:hypothetical protein